MLPRPKSLINLLLSMRTCVGVESDKNDNKLYNIVLYNLWYTNNGVVKIFYNFIHKYDRYIVFENLLCIDKLVHTNHTPNKYKILAHAVSVWPLVGPTLQKKNLILISINI